MRRREFLQSGFSAVCGAAALQAQSPAYDLLLRGARVIDPKNNLDAVRDVAIQNGRIARVEARIDPSSARKSVDLTGLLVTPALVDMHTHLFHTTGIANAWAGDNSVPPDAFSFRTGVTTMVDAGSAGRRNFETFRHTVIDRARTRVFAMVNVAGLGMVSDWNEQDVDDMQPEQIAALARKHADVIVGIKSAHYMGPEWVSVDRAIEAGKLANLPVMVDFGFFRVERPYWQLVSERLRPGDISTHMYRAPVPYLDRTGKLPDYLRKARQRGVKFDVGHGGGSLVLRNAAPSIAAGFYPDSISTDLHTGSMNGAMMDMPATMSKLMAMGLPLPVAIACSTWNPAQMIRHPELGHLTPGAVADVAVWNVLEGKFGFADANGGRVEGKQRLQCEMTLQNGRPVWDWNARLAADYRTLPNDYGIRPKADTIILP